MKKWIEIEYFHPEGKSMPNGICYQRGWFSRQCRENMAAFGPVSDDVKGILVLPSQGIDDSTSHKHLFNGRFTHNGVVFDETSPTIEISTSYNRRAKKIASQICESYNVPMAAMKLMPSHRWYAAFCDKTTRFLLYNKD